MLALSQIPFNGTVSFDLYPSALLGTGYKNAKVLAIVDAESCKYFGVDPQAAHVAVYPTLPAGTPNSPRQYPWLKLQLQSGNITAVGLPWIVDSSFEVVASTSMRFTVPNVAPGHQQRILDALSAIGYTAVDVETLS
jgi:hypothetical protein